MPPAFPWEALGASVPRAVRFRGRNLLSVCSFGCQTRPVPFAAGCQLQPRVLPAVTPADAAPGCPCWKNSPKQGYFLLPFPVIWWFVHVSRLSQAEGLFVCQQQVLNVFIGDAAILWYERFQLCRTRRYLDQSARAVYIFHTALCVHAYLKHTPIALISRWGSMS